MLTSDQFTTIQEIVGAEHASLTDADRSLHAKDQSSHPASMPDAVVWPASTAEVSAILRLANTHKIPIVGWGAGSSLEGNPIPVHAGIVVNFGRMNRILKLHAADFQVTVQPGVLYKDMNKELARSGLFFAPDPGANASIGGMVANNAAGTRTVKYGATRDNVLALEVVLANGEIIRTGSRSLKQSAGYDLTHLFTGSEGTLGLITEATLKLAPMPAFYSAVLAAFESVNAAADTVYEIIGSGLNPAALELIDDNIIKYLNTEEGIDLPVKPTLLMEFHGSSRVAMEEELGMVKEMCREQGCLSFATGVGAEERNRLWEGRHRLGEILIRAFPGHTYLTIDISVPISNYPKLAKRMNELYRELTITGGLFGHAGDGNMHALNFAHPDNTQQVADMHRFNDEVVQQAIALNGTCTGEHGVGIGKQKYMESEHGPGAMAVMRQLKQTLDPNNIMNPGKVVATDQ